MEYLSQANVVYGVHNYGTCVRLRLHCAKTIPSSGSVEIFMFHGILEVWWNFREIWWNLRKYPPWRWTNWKNCTEQPEHSVSEHQKARHP